MEDSVFRGVATRALPARRGLRGYLAQLLPGLFGRERGHDFFEARVAAQ
jgi:hypothetical protein